MRPPFPQTVVRMKKYPLVFLTILILLTSSSGQERDWLKRSDLVFEGEVLKLFAATVDIPDRSHVALVRVTEIIEGEPVLRDYLQQPITVRFRDIDDAKPGQRAIFYATLWISGRGLAVNEIGNKRLENSDVQVSKEKEEVRREQVKVRDDKLRDLVKEADVVVAGRVLSLKRLEPLVKVESEHDPLWTEAEIEVEENLKGDSGSTRRVKITFAASNDIMWVRSPKFVRGQAGIWLLRREVGVEATTFGRPPNFVVVERDQFISVNRKDDVRRAIR